MEYLQPKPLTNKIWLYMEETNYRKIERIIKGNNGYITRKDINKEGIASIFLYEYAKRNGLIKHGTGFYSLPSWIRDEYLILQYEYPKLIFSFSSAQYINNLGDYCPVVLEVTGPKNYRPFPLPREGIILHTDTRENIYSLGIIESKTTFGNPIRVYNKEKTVCDFIKNRNKIDSESFVKCMNYYKRTPDKDIPRLIRYAKAMKIDKQVNDLMEVLLNED